MFDPYVVIIGASILLCLSYIFDIVSKRYRIPSVLFLIFTGIILKYILGLWDISFDERYLSVLELLGIIGLIMIVLEAAVGLKLSRDKLGAIGKSLFMAVIILLLSAFSIAFTIMYLQDEPFFNALVYAIPLSVVSSAVLIPSVHTLTREKKEFMVYESTFSDIAGIMFFNFIVFQEGLIFSASGLWMLVLTILVSIIVSYFLVYFFSRLKKGVKLFLMIAFLALLYSFGKMLHLSSLLIILIFGLILNNAKFFFKGWLSNFLDFDTVGSIGNDFKVITAETAFVVRTFFFVAFGLSIDLSILLDFTVLGVGSIIVIILFLVRFVNFRIFLRADVFPEIFLAPRGLITILLFFSIPAKFMIEDFSVGILFFVILATSIIMMFALIKTPPGEIEDLTSGRSESFVRLPVNKNINKDTELYDESGDNQSDFN